MNKGGFEIRAPPLSAGAEPKGADLREGGIRVPSLRRAFRFWFRAKRGKGIATGRAGGGSYGY